MEGRSVGRYHISMPSTLSRSFILSMETSSEEGL